MLHEARTTALLWVLLGVGCSAERDARRDGGDATRATDDDASGGDTSGGGDDEPATTTKRVFATSGAFLGDLYHAVGGLIGGDDRCASAATALGGTWKVWLSTPSVNAIDRIADVGPWYLVDETTLVFANKAQISAGPSVPINQDETGGDVAPEAFVWTGTAADGTALADTCSGWTSPTGDGLAGRSDLTGSSWTNHSVEGCSLYALLYCFEQ
jgi:hypothetical protein